jgi:integrase
VTDMTARIRAQVHEYDHAASGSIKIHVDVATVSRALGHANVHITLTTYAHSVPKAGHGAADRMAALLAQSGNRMETAGSSEARSTA